MKKSQLTQRWLWILAGWPVVALLLAVIPQIGIAVLEWQADECSVPVGDGYQVLRGKACDQYFPELSGR